MQDAFNSSHTAPSRPDLRWLLEQLYPVPDPNRSFEEWQHFCHHDLGELSTEELALERAQVVFRLTFDRAPNPWLLERLDAIDARLPNVA